MSAGEYMNYGQATTYTGLSDRTLKRAVANRELTHIKQGRRTLFRKIDLDKWMSRSLVKNIERNICHV
jgi:excisionase family DNA binding protein